MALGNIELTGPYDTHMMTLKGEPHWFTRTIRHQDGSASVVMSCIDPFFQMKVNFTARLVPGLAAMELHNTVLKNSSAFIVNLVHDAVVIECDNNKKVVYDLMRAMKEVMEAVPERELKPEFAFPAEFSIGKSWGNMK